MVYREMVYVQFARVLYPGRQLRRFVEVPVPEEGFPERLDLEYFYALTGSRRETREHARGGTGDAGQPSSRALQPTSPERFPTSSYAAYEQSLSSSGDDQPLSPQQLVQETLPDRLIRTQRPREDNLDSGLLEPSARRQRTQILPASASDLLPTTPNAPEREESEAEERHREGIRLGDALVP
ncbi:hypothetical protein Efla_001099 [Eimeria flavescens]